MNGTISVSLAALRHNAGVLRDLVGPGRAAFVVKSNAYGHGLVETALAVEPFAARFCVFTPEEAIALRDGGITQPILVLGPVDPASLADALAAELELAIWDTGEWVRSLSTAARKRQTVANVHVKVNTGLNRLGFEPLELADAIEDYLAVSAIGVTGIFSHLASAEEIDSPFTMQQLDTFERALASARPLLEQRGIAPIRHIAASAAAMLWPQTRLDMSRFGIALYGLWPSPQTREACGALDGLELQPALSYRSALVVVRAVAAGSSVGYGAT
ncbi:MAG TPA: alanine racemase, partial [Candidatus Acidoferrales bacterium]|nr:alanine racemase [Candidatus Acidoferrales bacterium]